MVNSLMNNNRSRRRGQRSYVWVEESKLVGNLGGQDRKQRGKRRNGVIREERHKKKCCILLMNADIRLVCEAQRRIEEVELIVPKSANQPLNRLDCRHESQFAPRQAKKRFNLAVKFLIFTSRQLRSVLGLTLLTKNGRLKPHESIVQLAKLFESWVAYCIKRLVTLRGGNPWLPD